MRHLAALILLLAVLGTPGRAHAYSFKLFSVLVSGEAGVRLNNFRLSTGTRRTPASAVEGGVSAEVVVFAPRYYPSRVSVFFGLWPDAQGTWDFPTTGRRPSPADPFPNPNILNDFALGLGGTAGVRYRWETGYAFVPFVDAAVFARAHKPVSVAPPHLNVGVRAGGGMEYWLIHRLGLFMDFHLQGGPLLYPLPGIIPLPEASTEFLVGIRVRAY